MRYEALIAAVLVLSQVAATSATAAPRDDAASPQFTAAETSTVGRNELLRVLIDTDPWLVRQILDAVARRDATDGAFGEVLDGAAFVSNAVYTGAAAPSRSAASVEWLSLLHEVRNVKRHRHHHREWTDDRSAKGSLELLESLKKARKEKGGK